MTRLEAVQDYTRRGFSLVPFRAIPPEPGQTKWHKKPIVSWEDRQRQAPDKETVLQEFRQYPDALIGCCTGNVSGIVNLDVDDDEGRERADDLIPDSLLVPTYKTISGGQQMIFKAPEDCPSGAVRFLPGLDFRGKGSCTILPPSDKGYIWMDGLSLSDVEPPPVPNALLSAINNNINNSIYRDEVKTEVSDFKRLQVTSSDFKMFENGRRDNDLFHIANILTKGGMPEHEIVQVLEHLIISWGETPDQKWIETKIQSALQRAEKREINFSQEVRDFVVTSNGFFLTSDVFNRLQVTSRQEKKNVVLNLLRLKKEGIIEKHGNKDGCYRKIETDIEPVNFLTAPTGEFKINIPMGVSDYCILYPGNIIMVAGSKSAGKTAFLLNIVKDNPQHEIVYLNSEMGDTEFRKRLELFGTPLSDWKFRAYHRSSNFADLITPEKKIFIVDFLEVTTDFWKVAQYIQEIHKKLKDGICIIALQKSEGRDNGRGGDFSKEKARLYLSLDYLHDKKINQVKIVDAKAWRKNTNPRGMYRQYKLANGAKFIPVSDWKE
ncbi:MAG TPA: bifunctional DNA primase/polymerase [Smithella sp.]|nr:bifunctional DNA primase/polymerase [Smithella sp.]